MFVEKLEKQDFIDFIKNFTFKGDNNKQIVYDYDNLNFEKSSSKVTISIPNKVYLHSNRFLNHCNRAPDLQKTEIENITNFEFSDFDFDISEDLIRLRFGEKANWLKFMYLKFGTAYKKEFLKFRENEKAKVLKNTASEYDNETKNWANNFNDCQGK